MRVTRTCCLLGFPLMLACADGSEREAGIHWAEVRFGDLCRPTGRVAYSAKPGGPFPTSLDRLKWLSGNVMGMVDRGLGRVVLFDSRLVPTGSVGRLGDGPGEFRFPADVVAVGDSELAVVDPAQMRVTRLAPDGKVLGSFATSRFAPRRAVALPGGRIGVGGLNDMGSGHKLLAIYRSDGTFERAVADAPPLVVELTPRVDDVTLAATPGGTILLTSAALPILFMVDGDSVSSRPLSFPEDVWSQLRPPKTPHQTPADIRKWVNAASLFTASGLHDDSTLTLAWHSGPPDSGAAALALLPIHGDHGTIVRDVPGWVLGVEGEALWLVESQTGDSTALASYACRPRTTGRDDKREVRSEK